MVHIVIDRGNSRLKAGLFIHHQREQVWQGDVADWPAIVLQWLAQLPSDERVDLGWLSVAQPDWTPHTLPLWQQVSQSLHWHTIDRHWPFPLKSRYQTPETLGIDRLVGVVAAQAQCPKLPVLVIDAGTAITYDLANAQGEYLGGAIAPGMAMRFQALHQFTARLPLVSLSEPAPMIGDSTLGSIRAGVFQGLRHEINGMVQEYQQVLGADLQVFLTGGDVYHFENQLSCLNFADSFLLLNGIHHLLTHRPQA